MITYLLHKKMENIEEHLSHHGVKPTAVRIRVWKEIHEQSETFTLADVERWMPEMDRSSIFRSLKLFAENHLLHIIDDGMGMQKYCVCRCENGQHLNHVHFSCVECGQTYCLEDSTIPVVQLPAGFVMKEVEYIVKGICPKCRDRRR